MKFEDFLREEKEVSFEEGADAKVKELVRKKLAKGLSVEAIAEALEESEDKIRELIEELSTSN